MASLSGPGRVHSHVIVRQYLVMVSLYQFADTFFGAVQVAAPRADELSQSEIGLLVGTGSAALFVLDFPSGVVADRIGRRRTLAVALVLTSAGFAMYAAADSLLAYVFGAVVWAGGMAAFSGTPQSWLVDELATERPGYAELEVLPRSSAITNAFSAVAGGAATVLIAAFGIDAPLVAGAVLSGALLALVARGFHESPRQRSELALHVDLVSALGDLLRSHLLRRAAVAVFLGSVPLAVFILLWPLTAIERVGFDESLVGVLLMVFFLAFAGGHALAAIAMRTWNPVLTTAAAGLAAAGSSVALAVFGSRGGFVAAAIGAEVALGAFAGAFFGWIQLLIEPVRRAAHTSAFGALVSLALVVGSPVAGFVAERSGLRWAWLVGAGGALLAATVLVTGPLSTAIATRQIEEAVSKDE